ncbi:MULTISPECIES: hypothetical protein [Mesotoga]|jgi:hypothetical protein|uniref:hypothetical protein n=2 Tax=Kosmotogaceae TaxID=1643948 RepID=UPI0002CB3BB4|nr:MULTISPECIES: hypothetical protein [Mesotoga]MCP5457851.1 hypothetical protein [Thermotogota bacterium]CCU84570.1 conserved exported hypothetical protein [Mesotoga infera]MDK2944046.1 hypothetical protein [Mesotoga sp.]RLL85018.1 hypothetical protein Y696_12300 [Mesotoga sp. H07pep.5.4]HNQ70535.1 hypothetical protein [Mesotoga prima]
MKRFLVLFFIVFSVFSVAETVRVPVSVSSFTGEPIAVTISMSEILDLVGVDFDANWDSLKVVQDGKELPYQIDDTDLNGKLSSGDVMAFLITGPAEITVTDDFDILPPEFVSVGKVVEEEGQWLIEIGEITAVANSKGLVKVTGFGDVEGTIVDELGIVRMSGYVGSTYYVDGEYGRHEEKTSGDFIVKEATVLPAGPVGITVVSTLEAQPFLGITQKIITTLFSNGDIISHNTFEFATYAELMKLQIMATRVLTDAAEDTVHTLPVFRRLLWADQLNITPLEYWLDRNAIMFSGNKPYIVFPAVDSMRPLWWGATYIFASQESWRANYSQSLKTGVAEINPEVPVVVADYEEWMGGLTWVYESREFRDGYFEWMPGEIDIFESTKDYVSSNWEDYVKHFVAGDVVSFKRVYSIYSADSIEDSIEFVEMKKSEIQSLKIGE